MSFRAIIHIPKETLPKKEEQENEDSLQQNRRTAQGAG